MDIFNSSGSSKCITSAALFASTLLAINTVHADVTPASVEQYLSPGGSAAVSKTVDTPPLPPALDLYLMIDLSGSYSNDLPNIAVTSRQVDH